MSIPFLGDPLPAYTNALQELITERAREAKVLLVPGKSFFPGGAPPSPYVRAAYSLPTPEAMDEALRRLASLLPEPEP